MDLKVQEYNRFEKIKYVRDAKKPDESSVF